MSAKINKALDLNKLFQEQSKGKLLKKNVKFPVYASTKFDGNYTVIIKECQGNVIYISSGGHEYTNNKPTIFDDSAVSPGVYIAERIANDGKLGDRKNCALRGSRGSQIAYNHKYMVHDYMSMAEYRAGRSDDDYDERIDSLVLNTGIPLENMVENKLLYCQGHVDEYLVDVVKEGYEGIMLKSPSWIWQDTKSRKVDNVKYKKRPTADLYCVRVTEGEGKYEGMIGALVLQDSKGREVAVGSGLNDDDRAVDPSYFIGEVVEIDYEQIMDTYIQPTFITIRLDKGLGDID